MGIHRPFSRQSLIWSLAEPLNCIADSFYQKQIIHFIWRILVKGPSGIGDVQNLYGNACGIVERHEYRSDYTNG